MKALHCCRCDWLKMAFNPTELRIYNLAFPMIKLLANSQCGCQPRSSGILTIIIRNDCDGRICHVSRLELECVDANRVRIRKQICDIAVALLVISSRILGICFVACSSLRESFSSSQPSDAEFGLACSSRCAVCLLFVCFLGVTTHCGCIFTAR